MSYNLARRVKRIQMKEIVSEYKKEKKLSEADFIKHCQLHLMNTKEYSGYTIPEIKSLDMRFSIVSNIIINGFNDKKQRA